MKEIAVGNWMLVACSIFYLAWWLITFRPPAPKSSVLGTVLLVGAFATGLIGMYKVLRGITTFDGEIENTGIPGVILIIGGVILYVSLLIVTRVIFHRQVTSELFIITGWAVLEIAAVNFAWKISLLKPAGFIIWAVTILIIAVISLICYILYYNLPYVKGYIDGCIPLVLVGVTMLIMNLMN